LVPLSLAKFGIKKTMTIGLVALVIRYAAYCVGGLLDQRMFYFAGIWIHGIIFGFFFVGGQVYIDKKAPPEIRAQAQGLIGLLCFGVGWLVGNFVNAMLIEKYTVIQDGGEALTDWNPIWMITIISTVVLLGAFLVFFRDDIRDESKAAEEAS
jgi:MFS family permease